MYKFVFLLIFSLLSGCAAHQRENIRLADLLQTQNPQLILDELQKIQPVARDAVQFHLNVGFLQFINGDFQSAIKTLTLAKQQMAKLEATSISENIGAGSISEAVRSYSGYPTDRVMVHNILALSYLFSNDVYAARVEVLQAELVMKKLAEKDSESGQLASANLLGGVIYELLDEQSNALISYRDAAQIMEKRGLNLPLGLKQALLRISFKMGLKEQYLAYQKKFPGVSSVNTESKNNTQLFALYFDGVVSHKIENSIMVPNPNFNQFIRISMPAYPAANKSMGYVKINQENDQVVSEMVEDVDLLAREDLAKDYASILLLTTSRAIVKYQLVNSAQKQDPLWGGIVNILTV